MGKRSKSVALVSGDDHSRTNLRDLFKAQGWEILESTAVSEFQKSLNPNWSGVVLTDCCLPDGNWQDVVSLARACCPASQVVVTSRIADEFLWAEVLDRGAFDLLAQPLETKEVSRVVHTAWQHCGTRARAAAG